MNIRRLRILLPMAPAAAAALLSGGCTEDLSRASVLLSVDVRLLWPDADGAAETMEEGILTFRNLSSGRETQFSYPTANAIKILPGLYDVSLEARDGNRQYYAVSRSVEVMTDGMLLSLGVYVNAFCDDLVIAEIFFTGTLQASGNQYYGDDYVKLYNNTDHVVYADGITLFESKFTTTEKVDYIPDIMGEAVTVQALYTIPGSGREHPVQPGEYILLADTGIDHRQVNPRSFDLSHADWEWFDVSSRPGNLDIDSPLVDNLDKWYCYTQSFFMLHNRGFKAIGIARIPIERDIYLRDYRYTYEYETVTLGGTFPMSQSAYRLPNEWVVDVVNCSVASMWAWNVTDASLDRGWTYCGSIDNDKTRYFHSVRRRLLYVREDGRAVLRDTNDSGSDFNPMAVPSEIELQGTPIGLEENGPAIITYDGVTPVGSEPVAR